MQRGRWASDASRLKCTRARDSCLRATLPDTPRNQPSPTSPSGPRWSRDTTWPGWGVSRSGWGPGDLSIRSPSFPVSPPTMHAWEEDRRRIFYLDTHSFKRGGWGGEQICWQLPCRDADVMTFVVARYVHATWLLASIPYFHFPVVSARSVGFFGRYVVRTTCHVRTPAGLCELENRADVQSGCDDRGNGAYLKGSGSDDDLGWF